MWANILDIIIVVTFYGLGYMWIIVSCIAAIYISYIILQSIYNYLTGRRTMI